MKGLGARLSTSAVIAPAKLASASPASRITVRLVRGPAISTSAPTETSAPRMPATGTNREVAGRKPKAITNEAAAAAACGAPNKAGSASGLRNNPCKAAPENPSVAPISAASSVRGNRISRTIIAGDAVATPERRQRRAHRQTGRADHQGRDHQREHQRGKCSIEPPDGFRYRLHEW